MAPAGTARPESGASRPGSVAVPHPAEPARSSRLRLGGGSPLHSPLLLGRMSQGGFN